MKRPRNLEKSWHRWRSYLGFFITSSSSSSEEEEEEELSSSLSLSPSDSSEEDEHPCIFVASRTCAVVASGPLPRVISGISSESDSSSSSSSSSLEEDSSSSEEENSMSASNLSRYFSPHPSKISLK